MFLLYIPQRYDVITDEFEIRDKMHGRQLNDEDFKTQIEQFLFNGQDLRLELVDAILQQLTHLKNVVEQMDGYRFYSCSLLIFYEGSVEDPPEQREETSSTNDQHLREGSVCSQIKKDFDFQYGDSVKIVNNVISEDIIQKNVEDNKDSYVCSDTTYNSSTCRREHRHSCDNADNCNDCRCSSSSPQSTDTLVESNNTMSRREHGNKVDIRIVDFAHATFDGFLCDTIKHYGPDHGFLLGVNTLIEIFTELKDRSVS